MQDHGQKPITSFRELPGNGKYLEREGIGVPAVPACDTFYRRIIRIANKVERSKQMEEKELLELTEPFLASIGTIIKMSKQQLEKRLREQGEEITAHQYAILVRLSKGNLTVKELGESFSIEPPTLIPIIDLLERRNLVVRIPDLKDRRRKLLQVTERGNELISRMRSDIKNDAVAQAFLRMGKEKSVTLVGLLQLLAKELQ
jgi:DNA-binding MarR family transcriptional regulator